MQRRQFLLGTGAVSAIALAGCAGESDNSSSGGNSEASGSNDNSSSENDSSGGGSGDDESSGEDSGSGGSGLSIEEHELVTDDLGATVEGVVLNDTGEEQSYVQVDATVYNADGQQIETSFTNTENLGDGEEWAFELMLTSEESEIDEYELSVTDSAA